MIDTPPNKNRQQMTIDNLDIEFFWKYLKITMTNILN